MQSDTRIKIVPLLKEIRHQYDLDWRGLHGISHWARVYENGLRIASDSEVNLDILLLFSVFHDSRRMNDSIDPGHGRRGAQLAAKMRGSSFELSDEDFDLLYYACETHTRGLVEGHLAVKTCWDADRLDLARVRGFRPEPEKMCTHSAKDPATIEWASERARRMHIPELMSTEWGQ